MGISLFAYGYGGNFAGMLAIGMVYSLGLAAASPPARARVTDITPPSRRDQMIDLYGASEDLGLLVGSLVCGFVWDAQGPRLAFVGCSLILILGLALALFTREKRSHRLFDSAGAAGQRIPPARQQDSLLTKSSRPPACWAARYMC